MKVMQVCTDTNIGGAGIWLLTFLKYYDRENTDVVVVIPHGSALAERIAELGVRYVEADYIEDASFSIKAIESLKKIISEEAPEVVHTHASLSARIAAKLCKVPVVNTRHCIEPAKRGIKRFVYRTVNNALSDKAIAVSGAVYKNLKEDGMDESKLELIYNGVTPIAEYSAEERLLARMEMGVEGCFVAGIFARLEPVKNHRLFLEAASAAYKVNDKFRFLIVGAGSLEQELKRQAKRLEVDDAVIFTGFVQDITKLMNVIDVNVLSSDSEALSISVVEAMTVKKPCIATDAGGPKEVIQNGVSGIIVPVGDAVNLSAALLRMASDPALCASFGEAGYAIAAEKFSPQTMVDKVTDLYYSLADSRKGVSI